VYVNVLRFDFQSLVIPVCHGLLFMFMFKCGQSFKIQLINSRSKFVPMKNITEINVVLGDSRVDKDDEANEKPTHYEIQSVAIH